MFANHGFAYWLRDGYAAYVAVRQEEEGFPIELALGVRRLPTQVAAVAPNQLLHLTGGLAGPTIPTAHPPAGR